MQRNCFVDANVFFTVLQCQKSSSCVRREENELQKNKMVTDCHQSVLVQSILMQLSFFMRGQGNRKFVSEK